MSPFCPSRRFRSRRSLAARRSDANDPERPLAGMKFRSAASPPVGYAATLVKGIAGGTNQPLSFNLIGDVDAQIL